MSHSFQNPKLATALSQSTDLNPIRLNAERPAVRRDASCIAALNIEFVAKPNEAHKVHAALPAALNGALEGIEGFAGSFVMISNHEARLVTVVTLWRGTDRAKRCSENARWVRALLAPYLDRCLRIQTLAAFLPEGLKVSQQFERTYAETPFDAGVNEEEGMCVA